MNHEVIDNFLPQKEFQEIQTPILDTCSSPGKLFSLRANLAWVYNHTIVSEDETKNWKYFYMMHPIFSNEMILSSFYEKIKPVLQKLDAKALIRIKANLFPNSEKIHEHDEHIDYSFSHKAAILYINTCDGYTKLEDGTKIDSVANRVLLFDASKSHCSTTTSNATARFNININYF